MEVLEREFELLGQLTIASMPRPYEFVQSEGTPCLVLEDRGLMPLRDLLVRLRPGVDGCFKTAIPLCAVLGELHRRDIVHGGVNPGSILLDIGSGEVQLADFSLAVRSASEMRSAAPVRFGGAEAYMSPEQTGRMNRFTDYRTDFYSLGATLYELLTGAVPFRAEDPLELMHSHIAKTPVPPAELVPGVPEAVSEIVMKLLAKTAEDRYQSALGLKHDLETCQGEWVKRGQVPRSPSGSATFRTGF